MMSMEHLNLQGIWPKVLCSIHFRVPRRLVTRSEVVQTLIRGLLASNDHIAYGIFELA
jgi:hypothetical protein